NHLPIPPRIVGNPIPLQAEAPPQETGRPSRMDRRLRQQGPSFRSKRRAPARARPVKTRAGGIPLPPVGRETGALSTSIVARLPQETFGQRQIKMRSSANEAA